MYGSFSNIAGVTPPRLRRTANSCFTSSSGCLELTVSSSFAPQDLLLNAVANPPIESSKANVDGRRRLPTSLFDQGTDLDQQLPGFSGLKLQS
jgi:hypothetical protein